MGHSKLGRQLCRVACFFLCVPSIQCVAGGGGVLGFVGDHILQDFYNLYGTRFTFYKIAYPPQEKSLRGEWDSDKSIARLLSRDGWKIAQSWVAKTEQSTTKFVRNDFLPWKAKNSDLKGKKQTDSDPSTIVKDDFLGKRANWAAAASNLSLLP